MDVSFTGMQNIGATWKSNMANPKAFVNRIAIQLNNNGERDLDFFKDILTTHNDCFKSNFLDIMFDSTPNNLNPQKPYLDVFINMKKLEMNEKNLPIFAKINNLLKRISKGEERIPLSEDYLNSERCLGRYFSEVYGEKEKPQASIIKDLHEIDLVGEIANTTSKVLSKAIDGFYMFGNKEAYKEVKGVGGFHYADSESEIDRLFLQLKDEDVREFEKFFWNKELMPIHSKNLMVDVLKDGATQQTKLSLNNVPLEVSEENFSTIKRVVQLLKGIKETDKEIPFPKNYLTDESFNELGKWVIKENDLKKMYNADLDEKLERDIELDLITYDKSAKKMADKIAKTIDRKMEKYFS